MQWGSKKLASAACREGIDSARMASLAKLGTFGAHSSNVHRELMTFMSRDRMLPAPLEVMVPMLDSKREPPLGPGEFPVLLPHELVAHLAQHYPVKFPTLFGTDRVEAFWKGVHPLDPRLVGNPISAHDRRKFVPIWLHGDGVEFSTDSILSFSFGSLLCNDSSLESCFMVAAWPKTATAPDTWTEPFRIIAWSLTALFHGVHPSIDWKGRPI